MFLYTGPMFLPSVSCVLERNYRIATYSAKFWLRRITGNFRCSLRYIPDVRLKLVSLVGSVLTNKVEREPITLSETVCYTLRHSGVQPTRRALEWPTQTTVFFHCLSSG
jgi:hypothetical protein